MQIIRRSPGEASLVDGERTLLDLAAVDSDDAEFERFLDRLGGLFGAAGQRPRVALTLREGLLGKVEAEVPLEVVLIEDDPHDLPPLRLVRRAVEPDPPALAAMLERAEQRLARGAA